MLFKELINQISSFTINKILKDYYLDSDDYTIEEKRQSILDIKTPYEWMSDEKYRELFLDNISGKKDIIYQI